ncbi:MAG TPA: phytoene/squalene synthase family protein [Tepidisphaeraceae bacterium]|jgi:phytoene synthase|nr:phytoene/squalene synthase family protein [Tepidisphaeraceae bacterium]
MIPSSPTLGETLLERSRTYCEQLTRTQAKNFYYGLKLLPESKRAAMFALYAYMRRVDDIADDEDGRSVLQRLDDLESWRIQTQAAVQSQLGEEPCDPVWHALSDAVRRYSIPLSIFDEVIEGQRQDLEPRPFDNFEQLRVYCYRVAGVVGLSSIHVWGFDGGEATQAMAIDRGVAFQLTNILRDLREDAARGRLYLPSEELAAMNVSADDLQHGGAGFCEMMKFQIDRAESYYRRSADLEERIERDSRPTLRAMTEIYHGLLGKIAADPERVLSERVSLSVLSKLRIGWRALRAG